MAKNLTLGDFINAMEKNGFHQAYGELFRYNSKDNSIKSACALGQGFLNLNVQEPKWVDSEDYTTYESPHTRYLLWKKFTNDVIKMNDKEKRKIKTIVKEMRIRYADQLNTVIDFRPNITPLRVSPVAYVEKK